MKQIQLGLFSLVFGFFALIPGCSDPSATAPTSAELECTPFKACGGNLIGTWKLDHECTSPTTLQAYGQDMKFCDAATLTVASADLSGSTVTFTSNAVKQDLVASINFSEQIPASCLLLAMDCAAATKAAIESKGALDGSYSVTQVACTPAADGCSCNVTADRMSSGEDGYQNNGTSFTETNAGDGTMDTGDYCVVGSVLRVDSDSDIDVFIKQ